jgi:hypothetical protein
MLAVAFLQSGIKGVQVGRRLPRGKRVPAGRLAVLDDRPGSREIVLVEGDAGAHVEEVADRGTAISRGLELRDDPRHRALKIEMLDKACQQTQHRLGHRHEDVRGLVGHAVEVALVEQVPAVHDGEAVGIGLLQEALQGERFARIRVDAQPAEVRRLRREGANAARVAGNVRRRQDFAHMVKRPAVVRRCAPVRQGGSGGSAVSHYNRILS